ncbi:MAG: thiamine pyrophosphate-dependent enzyme [Pseudomonadota bacterium]
MLGLKSDWVLDVPQRYYTLEDYESNVARWCVGCGDHAVLNAVQRICRDEQLKPEKTVFVSGIGCSSRFPHYMKTYGFHSLHGRALPVACGVKARRPDLTVWVATGDGDCCSIGTAHWIHAIRYNMNLTVMMFDNGIYGLTKAQTSPTSPIGLKTNTHPRGAWLPPINPLVTTLGVSNCSFVARTVDWNPIHLYNTLRTALNHRGFSFVQIMQRCPNYTSQLHQQTQNDPSLVMLLTHENGVPMDDSMSRLFKTQQVHDPMDIDEARELADRHDVLPIGLFFRDQSRPCYEDYTNIGLEMSYDERLAGFEKELDKFAVSGPQAKSKS